MRRQILKALLLVYVLETVCASKPKSDDILTPSTSKVNAGSRLLDTANETHRQKSNKAKVPKLIARNIKPHIHHVHADAHGKLLTPMEDTKDHHVILESAVKHLPHAQAPKELLDKLSTPKAAPQNLDAAKEWSTKTPGFVKSDTLRAITSKEAYKIKPKRRTARPEHLVFG